MSRHRKIKALNYDDEYDDYYGAFDDDDDDFDDGDFESKYLSSGIDLNISESNNSSKQAKQQQQQTIDSDNVASEFGGNSQPSSASTSYLVRNSSLDATDSTLISCDGHTYDITLSQTVTATHTSCISNISDQTRNIVDQNKSHSSSKQQSQAIASDLTRLATQHLDKHQWQLPLLEMDAKFRDRTYYKHYTDSYISSLRSKLGHFLADNQLLANPMRHHAQRELDNYEKYSKMFELLTDYYQSLGGNFFSFATPSPDEEIVIGCRMGTKAKIPEPKNSVPAKDDQKAARFEYAGKPSNAPGSKPKQNQKNADKNLSKLTKQLAQNSVVASKSKDPAKAAADLTVREDFTAEQLDILSKKHNESQQAAASESKKSKFPSKTRSVNIPQAISTKPSTSSSLPLKQQQQQQQQQTQKLSKPPNTAKAATKSNQTSHKQLATLAEKRHSLKQKLKQNSEPSAQDWETFKVKALQTTKEYNDLFKGSRSRLNLVVVGHVDAGKSTLVGHLLFRLGQVTGKQMHRNEVDSQRSGKASFKFAWALDETSEERARGVTIDIALTKFETPHKDVVLLDAPGHVDFIPAVITGAAQADAALLVVDATRGEFETGFQAGGQTREHTFLVRSLGVKSLIVVVNKMDNVNWNWDRFLDIVDQLKPFLKQVGFNLKEDVQFVAVSGLTGDNLTERRQDVLRKQSSHPQMELMGMEAGLELSESMQPSLLESIDKMKPPERMVDKPTRVCVTDVFKGMSGGVFLGAKVISGKIEPKQRMLLLPPNEFCDIKQVDVRDSKSTCGAFAGDIITTVATGIDMQKYYRGCVLCDPLIPCNVTNRFQARIIMFQNASTILIKGTPIEVHINGSYECGQVRKLISLLNKSSGELLQKRPRCIAQNSSAIIQLKLERVVCCELYENNKDLGRFMVRSYGKTIAAGLITKIKRPKVSKSGMSKMKSK